MLIQGYTGALDIVTEDIALLFSENNINEPLPPNLSIDLIQRLQKRGYVTFKTIEEEYILANKIASAIHSYHLNNKKRFYFIVSYNCNFRCPYCFENQISNRGRSWSRISMTEELVDRAFDSFFEIEPNKEKHFKDVVLYGGEPLMAENKDIVQYIVAKGKKLGYFFHAITNGYDLDEFQSLLGEDCIGKVQITLDGNETFHNSRRFHYAKGASFRKILDNIKIALDKKIKVRVRANIDKCNINSVKELIDIFRELNFYSDKNFSFYPALLENHITSLITDENRRNIEFFATDDFECESDKLIEKERDFGILISEALKKKGIIPLQASYCGANKGMYIFDPKGDIYCCLETVGLEKHSIGRYDKQIKWNGNLDNWKGRSINRIPECSKCKYGLLCGGGCTSQIIKDDLDLFKPHCDNFPLILELNARKAYKNFICNN